MKSYERHRRKRMKELLKKRKNNEAVLLAEGDSWFSFFDFEKSVSERVKSFVLDHCRTNILEVLEKEHNYDVVEVAKSGDHLEQMASDNQTAELIKYLKELNEKKITPKAILFSGGGNDFACELPAILNDKQSGTDVLNNQKLKELIDVKLKDAYTKLIKIVTTKSQELYKKKIPILIHGYDYPVPDGRGVNSDGTGWMCKVLFCILKIPRKIGPWLKRAFKCKGYEDLQANTNTMKKVIDRFNCMLSKLDKKFDHVTHVDVRNCLSNKLKNCAYKEDWGDEMHPTDDGFEKVAKKFHEEI